MVCIVLSKIPRVASSICLNGPSFLEGLCYVPIVEWANAIVSSTFTPKVAQPFP